MCIHLENNNEHNSMWHSFTEIQCNTILHCTLLYCVSVTIGLRFILNNWYEALKQHIPCNCQHPLRPGKDDTSLRLVLLSGTVADFSCCKMSKWHYTAGFFVDVMTHPHHTHASTQTILSYHVSSMFKILSKLLHENHVKRC